ncbi:MAG TPA: SRPBCC family protein [Solirubrobacteraceae bacterium]|nr:SRPBCC family protein [Solirubrobacteraceae bacterium]
MARNDIFISAPVEDVFELLADPRAYATWVVGSREIRAADRHWPAPGARLGHTIGIPPVLIKDETMVIQARPPVRLQLRARARPLPSARITLDLQPERDGTRLTMVEDLENVFLNVAAGPLGHIAIRLRNREALRRLKSMAEGMMSRPRGGFPTRGTSARA